jgi:hypothetical protein
MKNAWFILDKLRQVKFYVKFHKIKMDVLGYIIFKDDICIILHEVQTIVIGLPQFMFMMFNVFLDSPTSIGTSLHIIPW